MEYKQFVVKAFEREPGKWRANVERADGKVLLRAMARRRRALDKFITGMDATAARCGDAHGHGGDRRERILANFIQRQASSARSAERY
jgi:hypothetical protein